MQPPFVQEVAKLLRSVPPARLDVLMRSPARRVVLEAIFWQMPRQLDRTRAARLEAIVRWQITGDGEELRYDLEIRDGTARVRRGGSMQEPRLTITLDGAEFLRLVTGGSDPMRAYFTGNLKLRGDLMLAAKLATLFKIPGSGA